LHRGQEALKKEASRHFKGLFKADDYTSPIDQVNIVKLFSTFVTEEDSLLIEHPCTKLEIWNTLKLFEKDKSLGPDDLTIELFTHFFYLLGDDLMELVEESRIR